MNIYRTSNGILLHPDGHAIPQDENNREYLIYLSWLQDDNTPEQTNQYNIVATWESIRIERDKRISACDWTQLNDAVLTLSERQSWSEYRQALRDIPQNFASPDLVVFPEVPA